MDEDIDVEQLIDEVRQKPCIWNRSLPAGFHTRTIMLDAWRSVAAGTNPQFGDLSEEKRDAYCKMLQKKWRNIRDQWAKSCKRVADQKRIGTPDRQIKYYVHHKQLRFLLTGNEFDCATEVDNSNSDTADSKDLDNIAACPRNKDPLKPPKRMTEVPKERQRKKHKAKKNSGSGESSQTHHDSKLYFFKSVLPSIEGFSVDEMLELQSGILNLIKGIKGNRIKVNRRHYQPNAQNDSDVILVDRTSFEGFGFLSNDKKPNSTPCYSSSLSELSVSSPSESEDNSS